MECKNCNKKFTKKSTSAVFIGTDLYCKPCALDIIINKKYYKKQVNKNEQTENLDSQAIR
jgi:hypothetical protein